jgi:hypothetical protein
MKLHAKFEKVRETAQPIQVQEKPARDDDIPPAAKNLALAHHLQRLIDRGLVSDFTAASRMLGVSQPRLTHLMGLLLLAPEIQAAILLGEMRFGDKALRVLARIADWGEQMASVRQRRGRA